MREEERERETSIGCLPYASQLGVSNAQPKYVPWLGIEPSTFWCLGRCSNQQSHPARATTPIIFRDFDELDCINIYIALAGVAQWIGCRLQTKGSPVRFPVWAHAWVAGQVPNGGHIRGNHTLMFLSLSFSLPSPSLKINK